MLFGEAPSGHYLIEPRLELFVGGDFVKGTLAYEPHFIRLPDVGVKAVEGAGFHSIDGRVDRVFVHARCFIAQEPLFCDLIAINRGDIDLKSFKALYTPAVG